MNRNFAFKQLLRAYLGGIISEKDFENEMSNFEGGVPAAATAPVGMSQAYLTPAEAESSGAIVTLAEFEAKVVAAADEMIERLERFNSQQKDPAQALRSAASLRPRFQRYFRRLLSSEFELAKSLEEQQEASTGRNAE